MVISSASCLHTGEFSAESCYVSGNLNLLHMFQNELEYCVKRVSLSATLNHGANAHCKEKRSCYKKRYSTKLNLPKKVNKLSYLMPRLSYVTSLTFASSALSIVVIKYYRFPRMNNIIS